MIIPTYNRPTYLSQAIESVLCQTRKDIEIIIIDDGSIDSGAETKKILSPYLSTPNLTYLYQENSGIGAAVNRGLAIAQGEFIQRLDDDDRLEPTKVERSVSALRANPQAGLVATGYYIIDSFGKRQSSRKARSCTNPGRLFKAMMGLIAIPSAVMVPKVVHQKIGGYRTDLLGEDYEMWIRIAQNYEVETIDEPLTEYRRHSTNITRKSNHANFERDLLKIIQEYIKKTALNVLIPNLTSPPHAYALRAALYLQRDGQYVRTTALARKELERGLSLSPQDPLLSLWKGILAVCGDESHWPLPWEDALPAEYREKAATIRGFIAFRDRLMAKKIHPSEPSMLDFRRRFTRFHSALIAETFGRAIEKRKGETTRPGDKPQRTNF